MDYYEYYITCFTIGAIIGLIISAVLGLIPANIAKRKGYSFGLWWFYGFMLFIVAIIHVSLIPDKNIQQTPIMQSSPTPDCRPSLSGQSAANELKKFKELLDSGIITPEEFRAKKEQLLKRI